MTVAMIEQHIRDLAKLLRTSKATAVAGELDQIADGFRPFLELPLAGFAGFLVRADEFARTGQVATTGAKPRAASTRVPKAPRPPKVDSAALVAGLKSCDEQASRGELNQEELNGWLTSAQALSKPDLIEVARTLEIRIRTSDSKPKISEAIRQAIEKRHGSKLRSQMIHPPELAEPVHSAELTKPQVVDGGE